MSEFRALPGQNIKEEKSGLLQSMFHIGQQPFDQVISTICVVFNVKYIR